METLRTFTGSTMPIQSNLRFLLAQLNVERARRGEAALSLRRLALESGCTLSVLTALAAGKSQRIDYSTIDRLLGYLNKYITVDAGDLLVWTPPAAPAPEAPDEAPPRIPPDDR
jgi:hypothetical protein